MNIKRHMKGEAVNFEKLVFPVYGSFKLDGIRASVQNQMFISNSGKPLANEYLQSLVHPYFEMLDMELIVGAPNEEETYNRTSSAIRRKAGEPDLTAYVFDFINGELDYEARYSTLLQGFHQVQDLTPLKMVLVEQVLLTNMEELEAFEQHALDEGYEGIMLRKPKSPYKHGKSTVNQGWMLKLKRFKDSEGILVNVKEQLQNCNEKTIDPFGNVTRTSHAENKIGKGTTGKFVVRTKEWGDLELGSGNATDVLLQDVWDNFQSYKGRLVTFKYFPKGMKDKPRHPIFKAFRDQFDMDNL